MFRNKLRMFFFAAMIRDVVHKRYDSYERLESEIRKAVEREAAARLPQKEKFGDQGLTQLADQSDVGPGTSTDLVSSDVSLSQ